MKPVVLHCLNSKKTTELIKMTPINKYNPCIDYKPPFDKEEGTSIKLKIGNREGKIRLMTRSTVEEVLYTIKAFKNKILDLNIPTNNRLIKEFMN